MDMDIQSLAVGSLSAIGGLISLGVAYFTFKAMAISMLRKAVRFVRETLREIDADG